MWACQVFVVGKMNPVETWNWREGRKPMFTFENINGNIKKHLGLQLMQTYSDASGCYLISDGLVCAFSALWKDFILKTFYLFCVRIPESISELMFSIVLGFDI